MTTCMWKCRGLNKDTLFLNVWGYGALNAQGFRFACSVDLNDGAVRCEERVGEAGKP